MSCQVNSWHMSFCHPVFYPTTGPQPVLHRVRSSASSFSLQRRLFTITSSSSCLHLHLRLPVTSILPSTFPPIACFRRQFPRKMWPIQLAFLLSTVCTILLSSLTLSDTSFLTVGPADHLHPQFAANKTRRVTLYRQCLSVSALAVVLRWHAL